MKHTIFALLIACTAALSNSCSSVEADLERAQFLLDQARYEEAVSILEDLYAANPDDPQIALNYGSALMGRGFVGEGNNYLSIFADYLEGRRAGQTDMESVRTATPTAADGGINDVYDSVDALSNISIGERSGEFWLQLGFSRLAVIAVVGVVRIGALETANPCLMDFSAVSTADRSRIDDALNNLNTDLEMAGIEDFSTTSLGQLISDIRDALNLATNLQTYLESEYQLPPMC